ncbi:MAG: DUF655 domain-containing protein [Salinirussus sp.]
MSEDERAQAVVLDVLPHGRSEDDRPQYRKQPLVYAMGVDDFLLFECVVDDPGAVSIGDRISPDADVFQRTNRIEYGDLPGGAASELEYAVEDIVEAEEERFVDFYNEAQPITLRLHQLNLLPGIGKKLRNTILDERERRPFESFADLEERISGLHNPEEILVERIIEELREEDLKYCAFAAREREE